MNYLTKLDTGSPATSSVQVMNRALAKGDKVKSGNKIYRVRRVQWPDYNRKHGRNRRSHEPQILVWLETLDA